MEKIIKNISRIIKILVYIICVTLFLFSLWVLFEKHVDELTGFSVELSPEDNLTMPSLTICSEEAYRSSGYHYLEEDFVQNTFTMSEIFGPDFKNHTNVSCLI